MTAASLSDPPLAAVPSRSVTGDDQVRALAAALTEVDAGHRDMRHRFASAVGLSDSEYSAVMRVGRAVELTPKQLAQALDMTTGAVTAMIDRLESANLIERRPNPNDRRSLLLRLSPAGLQVVEWVQDTYYDAVAAAVLASTGTSSKKIVQILTELATAVNDAAQKVGTPPFRS
ncbi:MarR family winged helix-turn-helix transcriptional regulator [Lacisediminihabitans changchengi]|uniref:MarR family transcriptional regulator n=1 Tax=Lacisediminihabitans changchengi TaxID=2787634 RepID=A0A934W2Z6_9MICO|nr:MarR family transcriptional regulator [Lacisediminihabitans changchengi]MBK4347371.1 MarR family transcriptional regulator [Lacisediminihabitans changchengi]